MRASSSLSPAEVKSLARAIEASIADTLAREDSPEITYVEEAGADNPFDVYGKHGEPCPRCRRTLRRIIQGGRSTVFCPRCRDGEEGATRATERRPRGERDQQRCVRWRGGALSAQISQPDFFGDRRRRAAPCPSGTQTPRANW
jgi:hypothetical protein